VNTMNGVVICLYSFSC